MTTTCKYDNALAQWHAGSTSWWIDFCGFFPSDANGILLEEQRHIQAGEVRTGYVDDTHDGLLDWRGCGLAMH